MSSSPIFGDKQRMVGPASGGGGGGPDPATSPPPEVKQAGELGAVLRYALEDHTHQSPVVYWPQGLGPNDNVVSNRYGYITVTSSALGGTNFCSYEIDTFNSGLSGDFSVICGGYENRDDGSNDVICGGSFNSILFDIGFECSSAIGGGTNNTVNYFLESAIAGGSYNTISGPEGYYGYAAFIGGGYFNEVTRSAGVAHGIFARSYMPGQMSFSSGGIRFASVEPSEAQHSKVVVAGSTPGVAPNESVDLVQWVEATNSINLQASRAYMVNLDCVATRVGTTDQHNWTISASVRTDALGTVLVKNQSTVYEYSDASAALYAITLSASGGDLVVTFETGAGNTHRVNVCCTVKLTEVISTGVLGRHHVQDPSSS